MPAHTPGPADGCCIADGIRTPITLLSGHFSTTSLGNPVFACVDLLDEAFLQEVREAAGDVLPRHIEVIGHDRRRLHCKDIGISEPFENPIFGFSHPFGPVPYGHSCNRLSSEYQSKVAWYYYAVAICDSFVTSYKTMASERTCNDTPARSEKQDPGRGWSPRPGGRYPTTMSTDTTPDLKVGHNTDGESSGTNTIVADLQCDGWGGWDARDVLAGRIDDATVRQAVEVRR